MPITPCTIDLEARNAVASAVQRAPVSVNITKEKIQWPTFTPPPNADCGGDFQILTPAEKKELDPKDAETLANSKPEEPPALDVTEPPESVTLNLPDRGATASDVWR